MAKHIFLTGFMGSGKTTVGELLARELGWKFQDLDQMVERNSGKAISRIFAEQGETAFREQESRTLRRVLSDLRSESSVVALGGGTLLASQNRDEVQKNGILVYLETSFARIRERTRLSPSERPLLASDLPALFKARQPGYEAAPFRISTDERSPEAVAKEIAQYVRSL